MPTNAPTPVARAASCRMGAPSLATALALALVGCSDPSATVGTPGSSTGAATGEAWSSGSSSGATPTTSSDGPAALDTTAGAGPDDPPKYDVHTVSDPDLPGEPQPCADQPAGTRCDGGVAIICDGAGNVTATDACAPEICVPAVGCVVCLAGQFHCSGPRVQQCDTTDVAKWVDIDLCDPAAEEACDAATGTCAPVPIVGTAEATGTYYKFAAFQWGDVFQGGGDVDGYGDRLYVNVMDSQPTHTSQIDVYQVSIADSDGDGEIEPNQHPDSPDTPGPIEERSLTFVESIFGVTVPMVISSELYVLEDRLYIGGGPITEYVFGNGAGSVVADVPPWAASYDPSLTFTIGLDLLGYDDVNGVWYAGNESARRVFQYDAETAQWGLAFEYPQLVGDHFDGMEVVTDPDSGIPYVYVSDMTSDFIGQYHVDPEAGWVQDNLFAYADDGELLVEGMGFGAYNHFWITDPNVLYEIGGGTLQPYVDPEPAG